MEHLEEFAEAEGTVEPPLAPSLGILDSEDLVEAKAEAQLVQALDCLDWEDSEAVRAELFPNLAASMEFLADWVERVAEGSH